MKVIAPDLFTPRKRWPSPKVERHLRENPGVCPAILAADLGVAECFVRMVQRKLGLRKLTSPSSYRKPLRVIVEGGTS